MKDNKEIQKELADLSPPLAQIRGRGDGFQVPENYFDYLSESVMEQIKLEPRPITTEKKSTIKPPWYAIFFRPRFIGSLAGIAILLIAGLFFLNQWTTEEALVSISAQEAATYIANNLDEFDTNLFIKDNLLEEISEADLDDSAIDLYLEENLEEIDDAILEQLL